MERFARKETYSAEEKKFIMDRLNEARLIRQRAQENLLAKKGSYSEEEKKKIFQYLNEKRLSTQKREEIKERRTYKKEMYKFGSKKCYKFTKMEREYYIEISDLKKLSRRPVMITLYYNSIDELKRKDVLMKTESYSDKFFISHNPIRVYFKQYSLENEK